MIQTLLFLEVNRFVTVTRLSAGSLQVDTDIRLIRALPMLIYPLSLRNQERASVWNVLGFRFPLRSRRNRYTIQREKRSKHDVFDHQGNYLRLWQRPDRLESKICVSPLFSR